MRNLSAYKICFLINSVDFDNTSYTQIVQSIIKKQKERKEKMDF